MAGQYDCKTLSGPITDLAAANYGMTPAAAADAILVNTLETAGNRLAVGAIVPGLLWQSITDAGVSKELVTCTVDTMGYKSFRVVAALKQFQGSRLVNPTVDADWDLLIQFGPCA